MFCNLSAFACVRAGNFDAASHRILWRRNPTRTERSMSYHRSKAPHRRPRGANKHSVVALAVAAGLCFGLVSHAALAASLTLYSAQHEQTVDLLTKAFTKETGIDVKVHSGEGPGARQPARQGRRLVAGGRCLHRELAGTPIVVGKGTAGESRSGDARRRARAGQRRCRRLGRRSGARERARVQYRPRSRKLPCPRRCSIWRSRNGKERSRLRRPTPISCRWLARSPRSMGAPPPWNG